MSMFTSGREYVAPQINYNISDNTTIACYYINGPFHLKEIFAPLNEIYNNINNTQNLENIFIGDYCYFEDIIIKDCKFNMDITNNLYPNSIIGPFAELWFRNPNVYLDGLGKVELNFKINNQSKQITLSNINIIGSLVSINGNIEWKMWCTPQELFTQIQIIIDSYDNMEDTFPILNDLQIEKVNDLKHYFNIIKERGEENYNYYNNM